MIRAVRFLTRSLIVTTFGAGALFWSGNIPTAGHVSLIPTAEALVGAPLTPRSYAGVARRTTRRAVAVTGAATVGTAAAVTVGAATAGAVAAGTTTAVGTTAAVAARNCVRVIGPLGRSALVCR